MAFLVGEDAQSTTAVRVAVASGEHDVMSDFSGTRLTNLFLDRAGQEVFPLTHDRPWVARTLTSAGIVLPAERGMLRAYATPDGGDGLMLIHADGRVDDLYRTESRLSLTMAVSDDGEVVAFWRDLDTLVLAATGDGALGDNQRVIEHELPGDSSGSLAFAGDFVLAQTTDPETNAHQLWRVPRDGSAPLEIELPEVAGRTPTWLSVGNKALNRAGSRAVILAGDSYTNTDVIAVDIPNATAVNLTRRVQRHHNAGTYEVHLEAGWENQAKLAISPTGDSIAFVGYEPFVDHETFYGDRLYVVPTDGSTTPVEVPVPAHDLFGEVHLIIQNLVFLDDDQLLFGAGPGHRAMDLYSYDHSTRTLIPLTDHASAGEVDQLFAMRAGWRGSNQQSLLYVEQTETTAIRAAGPSNGDLITIAEGIDVPERQAGNTFTRCGGTIYFAADEQLWTFELDDPGSAEKLTDLGGDNRIPRIAASHDCRYVVFQCGETTGAPYGGSDMCVLEQGAELRKVPLPGGLSNLRGPLFMAASEIVFAGQTAEGDYTVFVARLDEHEPATSLYETGSPYFEFLRLR